MTKVMSFDQLRDIENDSSDLDPLKAPDLDLLQKLQKSHSNENSRNGESSSSQYFSRSELYNRAGVKKMMTVQRLREGSKNSLMAGKQVGRTPGSLYNMKSFFTLSKLDQVHECDREHDDENSARSSSQDSSDQESSSSSSSSSSVHAEVKNMINKLKNKSIDVGSLDDPSSQKE